ncbi:MAG: PrgI family protein [Solirubrobacteraceae bacterium]
MIHRTFRSLDDPPKLVGFTIKQWAALIVGASSLVGLIHIAHVPTKPAITLCVFLIGLPAALTYVSESGGLQLTVLLRAMWSWRWSIHALSGASLGDGRARGVVILAQAEEELEERSQEGSPVGGDEVNWERWG